MSESYHAIIANSEGYKITIVFSIQHLTTIAPPPLPGLGPAAPSNLAAQAELHD